MTELIVSDDDAERIAALLRSGPSDRDGLFTVIQKDFPNVNKVSLNKMLDEWGKFTPSQKFSQGSSEFVRRHFGHY